ncbi:conjugal transfer protein TraF [Marinobacter orientalis]|uniref:Conjugal transfer protein TraF n=1 Tax=Marinobacter orientalis TaxID=1928859 RepID=A0A7Y0NJJ3_9GAMM|nr:conjugal transfer protein TraF [Marinobacter orientalis]NMT62164.1 conjugal transfer protein TraF [Marinobacter orientalis]TGX50882.1 type IX secretion system membrane protein PorP/SprF [Marinobacter orientalis]
MTENRLSKLSLAIGLSIATTSAMASPQTFMSSRSFAMAGTGVAIAHPAAAGASNPAMMAAEHHDWSDDFGLILPSVNARFADEEETIDQIDDIQDTIDRFQQLDKNSSEEEARQTAGELRQQLNNFDRDTVRIDAGIGIALAVPTDSVSIGFFTNGNLRATVRGELDQDDDQLLATLENADPATLAGADLDRDLQSRGSILASAVTEVGISLATSIDLQNDSQLQIGLSPKYVQLRTFQYTQSVSGFEDDNFDNDENETDKSGFNLDVGAAYAFGSRNQWNAGVSIKNLIPMELDSAANRPDEDERTLELNPMVTAGIAHKGDFHVITAEADLTKKEAFGYEDDTQWVAFGAEFDAFRYAQLRVGVRQNLASNDDNNGIEEDTQFTAGIGLSPFGARLDIGSLVSDADVGAAIELGAAF